MKIKDRENPDRAVFRLIVNFLFLIPSGFPLRLRVSAVDSPHLEKLFEIIHEDDDLLVVNKPAGLVCHPTKGDEYSSLISRARIYLKNSVTPHLVHRLDRETSGVVLFAKNSVVARELGKIWRLAPSPRNTSPSSTAMYAQSRASLTRPWDAMKPAASPSKTASASTEPPPKPPILSKNDFRVRYRWLPRPMTRTRQAAETISPSPLGERAGVRWVNRASLFSACTR